MYHLHYLLLICNFAVTLNAAKRTHPESPDHQATFKTMPRSHFEQMEDLHQANPRLFAKVSDYGGDGDLVRVKVEPLVECSDFWSSLGQWSLQERVAVVEGVIRGEWSGDVVVSREDFKLTADHRLVLELPSDQKPSDQKPSDQQEMATIHEYGLCNVSEEEFKLCQMAAFSLEIINGKPLFTGLYPLSQTLGATFHHQVLAQLFTSVIDKICHVCDVQGDDSQGMLHVAVMLMSVLSSRERTRVSERPADFQFIVKRLLKVKKRTNGHLTFYPSFFSESAIGLVEECAGNACTSVLVAKGGKVKFPRGLEVPFERLSRHGEILYRIPFADGNVVTESAFLTAPTIMEYVRRWTDLKWHFSDLTSPSCNMITADRFGNRLLCDGHLFAGNRHVLFESDEDASDDLFAGFDEEDAGGRAVDGAPEYRHQQPARNTRRRHVQDGVINAHQQHTVAQVTTANNIAKALSLSAATIPADCPYLHLFTQFDCFLEEPQAVCDGVHKLRVRRKVDGKMMQILWGLRFAYERPHHYTAGLGLLLLLDDLKVTVKPYKLCTEPERGAFIRHLTSIIPKLQQQGRVIRTSAYAEMQELLVVLLPDSRVIIPSMPFVVPVSLKDPERIREVCEEALRLFAQ